MDGYRSTDSISAQNGRTFWTVIESAVIESAVIEEGG
jgi:hypothetical protein